MCLAAVFSGCGTAWCRHADYAYLQAEARDANRAGQEAQSEADAKKEAARKEAREAEAAAAALAKEEAEAEEAEAEAEAAAKRLQDAKAAGGGVVDRR